MVFEQAYSTSSWTAPASASLVTGVYPSRLGVVEGLETFELRSLQGLARREIPSEVHSVNRIPSATPTAAEILRGAGYRTWGIATNPNIGPEIGFDRGFDHFVRGETRDDAETVALRIEEWAAEIHGASDGPDFLYIHLNDVHSPYREQAPWFRVPRRGGRHARLRARYDSEISYLDRRLERIVGALGGLDNAIVVVASDHGELLGEHGLFRHGPTLHQELTRVVLLVRAPGLPPRRLDVAVSLVDVLPTVLDLAGLAPPARSEGRSLAAVLRGAEPGPDLAERVLFLHRVAIRGAAGTWGAVRDGWKLVETPEGGELFDLRRDPQAGRPLPPHAHPEGEALAAVLAEFREETAGIEPETRVTALDAELRRQLSQLGYVEEAEAP